MHSLRTSYSTTRKRSRHGIRMAPQHSTKLPDLILVEQQEPLEDLSKVSELAAASGLAAALAQPSTLRTCLALLLVQHAEVVAVANHHFKRRY